MRGRHQVKHDLRAKLPNQASARPLLRKMAHFLKEIGDRGVPLDVHCFGRTPDCVRGSPGYLEPRGAAGKSTAEHKKSRCPTSHDRNSNGSHARSPSRTWTSTLEMRGG